MRKGFYRPSLWGGGELSSSSSAVPLRIAASREPACGACGLHKTCSSPKMKPAGSGALKILVIGEAPGKAEDERGRPFVGPAGELLRWMFDRAGVSLTADCLSTNALACRPPNNQIREEKAVAHCRPNVLRAVRDFDPVAIVLAGQRAVDSLLPWLWKPKFRAPVGSWAGWRIPDRRLNCWVCPTFHPSFVLRQEREDVVARRAMSDHIAAACRLARSGLPYPGGVPSDEGRCKVVREPSEAARLIRAKIGTAPVAFDYETDRAKPDPADSEVVCCAVADAAGSVAYPWTAETREATGDLLFSGTPLIGYNCKFEQRWTIRHYGRGIDRGHWALDGMLAAHLLDSRTDTKALDFQAFVRLGRADHKSDLKEFMRTDSGNERNRLRQVHPDKLLAYCATDALVEYELGLHLAKEVGVTF